MKLKGSGWRWITSSYILTQWPEESTNWNVPASARKFNVGWRAAIANLAVFMLNLKKRNYHTLTADGEQFRLSK